MENSNIQSVVSRIQGMNELLDSPINQVELNGELIDVSNISEVGFGEEGNVTPKDFLEFLEENGSLNQEFFGNFQANLSEEGRLVIQSQNQGSKG